jgi:hypothetical protein
VSLYVTGCHLLECAMTTANTPKRIAPLRCLISRDETFHKGCGYGQNQRNLSLPILGWRLSLEMHRSSAGTGTSGRDSLHNIGGSIFSCGISVVGHCFRIFRVCGNA